MRVGKTEKELGAITDEGHFERLATAILREADPNCRALVHPGVNLDGKTVKSPLDGIGFVPGADPPHMVAVHHTTAAREELEKKWLYDPSATTRRGSRTRPAGDLIKTGDLARQERLRTPQLTVTLILTTNKEPSEQLMRKVNAAALDRGLKVDLWANSRLSHFLDQPSGQWIRRTFLGIEQEALSAELFRELSKKSLESAPLASKPAVWVPREIDSVLTTGLHRDVTFLLGDSGVGKSVACYRRLAAHLQDGGLGIFLSHEVVASEITLESAIATVLRQLHPALSTVGLSPLSFCTVQRPLVLVVEDINRSGQAPLLAEKLVGWSASATKDGKAERSSWRLLCPIWPKVLASLSDQVRKRIETLTIAVGGFNDREGREAVLARARLDGYKLSTLRAEGICLSLGRDPLLIALHDLKNAPDPNLTISEFVEGSIARAAEASTNHAQHDYRQALRALGREMLTRREIELKWGEIKQWAGLQGEPLSLLGRLAHQGQLICFTGRSDDQRISFRHDRVRDWLLADTATQMQREDVLTPEVVAEPYFAEIIGAVLVSKQLNPELISRVAAANPLALFHAFHLAAQAEVPSHAAIVKAIHCWLDDPSTHDPSKLHLRWEALAMLARTDSPETLPIVGKFREQTTTAQLARLRNGDLSGGVELCSAIEPGVGAQWRDIQIEHAKLSHGRHLIQSLADFLRRVDLDASSRIGALRLAGHIADPALAAAIEACWCTDAERTDHLTDYLWAFAECCSDDPPRFLGPVCDAWAALPNEAAEEGRSSPRHSLAAAQLRWAFRNWPPHAAIEYLVWRGSREALTWPMISLLHEMDEPKALSFVVREVAAIRRRAEVSGSSWAFSMMLKDVWRRAQESGRPMSQDSRNLLLQLWQDEANEKHLRAQAFSFWTATETPDDMQILRCANYHELSDGILQARLIRGDVQAIPGVIEKLGTDKGGYWWQYCRHLWSPALTETLDGFLERRGSDPKRKWCEFREFDWLTSEMIMRLPISEAERLLLKHWFHLRFSPLFVQAALYISTPRLLEVAQNSFNECPTPKRLLNHLSMHFGIKVKGHPGIVREAQIKALAPHLDLLPQDELRQLWEECNRHGWFALRRELLDARLQPPLPQDRWEREAAVQILDEMVAKKPLNWIAYRVDRFLKTGVLWSEILATMKAWLDDRRSLGALKLVAAAVVHRGTRNDLTALRFYEGMPKTAARQLIADAEFAVRRRSIS